MSVKGWIQISKGVQPVFIRSARPQYTGPRLRGDQRKDVMILETVEDISLSFFRIPSIFRME
jgi:hypothetical protein